MDNIPGVASRASPCAAATAHFPRFGPCAASLGIRSQAAVQLLADEEQAGLNLYALSTAALDSSTIQWAELFATQARGRRSCRLRPGPA